MHYENIEFYPMRNAIVYFKKDIENATHQNNFSNIMTKKIETGILHDLPEDMEQVLTSDEQILANWNNLTPIQRNEWICWVTIVKKSETRAKHIDRMVNDLKEGKRQPCCWPGCPHRRSNAEKWFKK